MIGSDNGGRSASANAYSDVQDLACGEVTEMTVNVLVVPGLGRAMGSRIMLIVT